MGQKMACDWLNMRSFHCPYLEGIGCNADFLSRFTLINPETLIFAERDKKEFQKKINSFVCFTSLLPEHFD